MTIRRIGGWIGAGLADAAGRLVILSATTAFLARLLPPGDFGATALTLSIVTAFSMAVGTPYEEALTQAKVVRRADLGAVLGLSTVAALVFLALCVPAGLLLDYVYGREDLHLLLPGTGFLLLAQGPMTMATAVARRRKAFYVINASSIVGHVAGALVAIGLGIAGAGIWALVSLRIVLVFATAASLFWMLGLRVAPPGPGAPAPVQPLRRAGPGLAPRRERDLRRLQHPHGRAVRADGPRLPQHRHAAHRAGARRHRRGDAQPLLPAFPGQRLSRDNVGEAAAEVARETSAFVAPTMMGLAAVSPLVVPLMAGPGWTMAEPIAAALAAGGPSPCPRRWCRPPSPRAAARRACSCPTSSPVTWPPPCRDNGDAPRHDRPPRGRGRFRATVTTSLTRARAASVFACDRLGVPAAGRLGVWLAAAGRGGVRAWWLRGRSLRGSVPPPPLPAASSSFAPLILISRPSFSPSWGGSEPGRRAMTGPVLVTGAGGFIGRATIARLKETGCGSAPGSIACPTAAAPPRAPCAATSTIPAASMPPWRARRPSSMRAGVRPSPCRTSCAPSSPPPTGRGWTASSISAPSRSTAPRKAGSASPTPPGHGRAGRSLLHRQARLRNDAPHLGRGAAGASGGDPAAGHRLRARQRPLGRAARRRVARRRARPPRPARTGRGGADPRLRRRGSHPLRARRAERAGQGPHRRQPRRPRYAHLERLFRDARRPKPARPLSPGRLALLRALACRPRPSRGCGCPCPAPCASSPPPGSFACSPARRSTTPPAPAPNSASAPRSACPTDWGSPRPDPCSERRERRLPGPERDGSYCFRTRVA